MSFPPNCGERYQHMLVPDCWWLCNEWEYAGALEKAQAMNRALLTAWNEIFGLDDARGDYTVTERWREHHNEWIAQYETLPEPWSTEFWQEALGLNFAGQYKDAQTIVATGACLLDAMVTDGQATYGDQDVQGPPSAPDPREEPGIIEEVADTAKSVAGAVGVLLVVAIGWAVFDRATRKGD